MTGGSPVAAQAFKDLKVANTELLRAMAREKRYRAGYEAARQRLLLAKRNVKLLLDVVMPELPSMGELVQEQATTLGEVMSTIGRLPEDRA